MAKKIFIIICIIVFALFVTSCRDAGKEENEVSQSSSVSTSQAADTESEADGEDVQTTESTAEDIGKEDLKIKETNPSEGEYFVYAILKSINIQESTIIVEQLINEPNEREIKPEVTLEQDCQIFRIVLEQATEKETITLISLSDIEINSEIGIIFNSDNNARAILFQEVK